MNNDLFQRVLVQLQPELSQEFGLAILEDAKKLKALEIIKNKKVDVSLLRIQKCDLHKYNECVISSLGEKPLTKEEYDIIVEEVLL